MKESYESIHHAFEYNVPDYETSGTTCCSVILNGHRITTANVGNSRAIVVNKKRQVTVLTQDSSLDLQEERDRIMSKGGKI